MSESTKSLVTRNYALDLLRFIAAFVVVIYHVCYRGYMADNYSPVAYPFIGSIFKYGYLGVELFFVISGYVVLMSAIGKTTQQFVISRISRLFPAYWVACTLTFLVVRIWGPEPGTPFWSNLMDVSITQYAINMSMLHEFLGYRAIDGVYWTLTVELCFYFMVSLLIAFKLFDHLLVILSCWLIYSFLAGSTPISSPFSFALFPRYAPLFIGGMLLYLRQINFAKPWKIYGLLLVSIALSVRNGLGVSAEMVAIFHDYFSSIIVSSVIVGIFLLLILITHGYIVLQRYKWLHLLGALTYPVYLLHHNTGYAVYQRLYLTVNKYVLLTGLLLVLYLTAYAVHTFVEKRYARLLGQKVAALFA
jgi:peptidoglycan/LPS O-acetylase OafA/YrhL